MKIQDPTKPKRDRLITPLIAAGIREAKGQWVLVAEGYSTRATAYTWARRHPEHEVMTEQNEEGGFNIFVRLREGA